MGRKGGYLDEGDGDVAGWMDSVVWKGREGKDGGGGQGKRAVGFLVEWGCGWVFLTRVYCLGTHSTRR